MSELRAKMDALPLWMKVILAIFVGPFYGGIYRFCSGTNQGIFVGLLWVVFSGALCGIPLIIDLITVITSGKPTVLVD